MARELATIQEDEPIPSAGGLLEGWPKARAIGSARCTGEFVDIGHSRSLAHLRSAFANRLGEHGIDDLDAGAIRLSVPRLFTQEISRHLYELSTESGTRRFAGVSYLSRLGDEIRNWAIFEPADASSPFLEPESSPIQPDDPDLEAALALLGIEPRL